MLHTAIAMMIPAAVCHFQPSRYMPQNRAAVAATTAITTEAMK
jgi:hypothetical protein